MQQVLASRLQETLRSPGIQSEHRYQHPEDSGSREQPGHNLLRSTSYGVYPIPPLKPEGQYPPYVFLSRPSLLYKSSASFNTRSNEDSSSASYTRGFFLLIHYPSKHPSFLRKQESSLIENKSVTIFTIPCIHDTQTEVCGYSSTPIPVLHDVAAGFRLRSIPKNFLLYEKTITRRNPLTTPYLTLMLYYSIF